MFKFCRLEADKIDDIIHLLQEAQRHRASVTVAISGGAPVRDLVLEVRTSKVHTKECRECHSKITDNIFSLRESITLE